MTIDCDSKYMLMVSRFRDCCHDSLGIGLLGVCTLMEGRGKQGDIWTVGVPRTFSSKESSFRAFLLKPIAMQLALQPYFCRPC